MAQRILSGIGTLGLSLAGGAAVVSQALYNVDGGQRAVIFDRFRGVLANVVSEGTHFIIPLIQKPIIYSIRAQPRNVTVSTGSKDLQTVHLNLRILYRPEAHELPKIYSNLGIDYDERILPSVVNEVLKAVVAQFDAHEMITQREVVSQRITTELTERAGQFGILLDDISLTHLTFGKEFTEAVELKQVAQQDAEAARYRVEQAEQMKQAAITSAEGDAQAASLLSKAFQEAGEGLVELRRLEAAEAIAQDLSKSKNVIYLPSNQNTLLNLPNN